MAKRQKYKTDFDEQELNELDIYYQPMQIGSSDKARRRELAELLTDAFLFFFATFEVHADHQSILEKQLYAQLLADKVSDAVSKVTGIDSYMSDHIREMSKQVVDTTFDKVKEVGSPTERDTTFRQNIFILPLSVSHSMESSVSPLPQTEDSRSRTPQTPHNGNHDNAKNPNSEAKASEDVVKPDDSTNNNADTDTGYWLSYKRAEDIAKSEANTFLNYTDYVDAKDSGKTKKTWYTMLDNKVRPTHEEVEGQTIDIDALFTVGDSLMKFPHDLSESPNPKEVIGCRCSVQYS